MRGLHATRGAARRLLPRRPRRDAVRACVGQNRLTRGLIQDVVPDHHHVEQAVARGRDQRAVFGVAREPFGDPGPPDFTGLLESLENVSPRAVSQQGTKKPGL